MELAVDIDSLDAMHIYEYPHPALKKVAEPVTSFDSSLQELCQKMLSTMYQSHGVGLAAPQVGINKRIFVIDIDFECNEIEQDNGEVKYEYQNFNPRIFINPKLNNLTGETFFEEGCLSFPGVYENVKRANKVEVDYNDPDGKNHALEAEDFLAVCIQHENDHLDGILFLERLSVLKRQLLTNKFLKYRKRYR